MSTPSNFLVDNWYWAVAAIASGSGLLWLQLKEGAVAGGLSPALAVQLINKDKAQVIDVSTADAFAAGHVAGAKSVPLDQIGQGQGKGLPNNKKIPLVVVCATGTQSGKAVAALQKLGHENVQALSGGLKAWREANLPVEKA